MGLIIVLENATSCEIPILLGICHIWILNVAGVDPFTQPNAQKRQHHAPNATDHALNPPSMPLSVSCLHSSSSNLCGSFNSMASSLDSLTVSMFDRTRNTPNNSTAKEGRKGDKQGGLFVRGHGSFKSRELPYTTLQFKQNRLRSD